MVACWHNQPFVPERSQEDLGIELDADISRRQTEPAILSRLVSHNERSKVTVNKRMLAISKEELISFF